MTIETKNKKNQRIAICTFYTPNFDELAKYSTTNFRSYCNKHGYDFIELKTPIEIIRPCYWNKIKLLQRHIEDYEWLMWIDIDAVITNKEIKLEDIIDYAYDIIVSKEEHENLLRPFILNAGVYLIKNSEWTKSFLEKWYAQEQFIDKDWFDQSALIYLYENDPDVRIHTKVVGQKLFNTYPLSFSDGDFIVHYFGYGNIANRRQLRRLAYYKDPNYVSSRDEIPDLLNRLGLYGDGIEIGVQSGIYSECILSKSKLSKLYLCDPWRYLEDYRSIANIDNQTHEKCFLETKERLTKFKDRIEILRILSQEAVKLFKNDSLDFVYIDANHKYNYILEDIENWYPKVKKGGIVAGHDFLDGDLPQEVFGVRSAVTDFFMDAPCIYITDEDWPSWYVIKE